LVQETRAVDMRGDGLAQAEPVWFFYTRQAELAGISQPHMQALYILFSILQHNSEVYKFISAAVDLFD